MALANIINGGIGMRTEIRQGYKCGYFISEIELTRIKDAQNEQIKKICGQDAQFVFQVKYRNGVVAKHSSIAEILAEENDGSKSITRIWITAINPLDENTFITVIFGQDSDYRFGDSTIHYEVMSDDKDWTFVTSSIIEERINKVKKLDVIGLLSSGRWISFVAPTLLTLIMLVFFTRHHRGPLKSLQI